jgi:metal-responsive CopG/Arc/MetJ family transcriptional regulator
MGKRVTFYLPDDLYNFLEGLRKTEHGTIPRSEVLKRVLADYMKDYDKPRFYRVRR